MPRFFRPAFVLVVSITLTACSGAYSAPGKDVPFPTNLPSEEDLTARYQPLQHDLSPLAAYHFRIEIPKDWKTLDTTIKEEPAKDALADVAVFRQPGAWMNDPTAPINGEISVSVVNVSGSTLSPADWLQGVLKKNAKGFTVINKQLSPSASGEVPDVLIQYTSGNELLLSRMMAFRNGNRMFVITGSDTAKEYKDNAEAFFVAISTFRLDSSGK